MNALHEVFVLIGGMGGSGRPKCDSNRTPLPPGSFVLTPSDLYHGSRVGAGAGDAVRQLNELRSELEALACDEVTAARGEYQLARRKLEAWDLESEGIFAELHGERLRLEAQLRLKGLCSPEPDQAPVGSACCDELKAALKDVERRDGEALKARLAGRADLGRDRRMRAEVYLRAGSRYLGLVQDTEASLREFAAARARKADAPGAAAATKGVTP